MQWRRFFTFLYALVELDESWTARLMASEFLRPRFNEMLRKAEEAQASAEEQKLRRDTGLRKEDEGKAHVRKLREKSGNAIDLSALVLGNRDYQIIARQMIACAAPIRDWYLDSVASFSCGRLRVAQWMAKRSCSWRDKAYELVSVLTSPLECLKLGIGTQSMQPFPCPELSGVDAQTSATLFEDITSQRAASLTNMVLCMLAQFAWYMLPFQVALPEAFAAAFHPDRGLAQKIFDAAREVWKHLCFIEDNSKNLAYPAQVLSCSRDVYRQKLVLSCFCFL